MPKTKIPSPRTYWTNIRSVLVFISRKHKKKLLSYAILQAFTGVLDLIGIVLIGVIGSLALHAVTSNSTLNQDVTRLLTTLKLEEQSLSTQVLWLSGFAAFCLVGRSVFAFFVSSRIFYFLGNEGTLLSSKLFRKLLNKDISHIQMYTRQESVFILTSGSNKAALDVAGSIILVVSDLVSLTLVVTALLILDPITASVTIVLFGSLGLALFNHLKNKASRLGENNSRHFVSINNSILMTLENLRFIKPANLIESRINDFDKLRFQQSKDLAELSVMPYVSKYVFEVALVLGALIISALQFVLHDAIQAITTLTVFLAAGGRLAPAALRLQQSSLLIRANIAYTVPVLKLYKESSVQFKNQVNQDGIGNFVGDIELRDICYQYPDSNLFALKNVNLIIPARSFVAIVGPSGAGKSTLIDVLLGLNLPQSGDVKISSKAPLTAYELWPGKVSYVPQRTNLIDGTIAENISYGRPVTDMSLILDAIKIANLEDVIQNLSQGLLTPIGELGSRLSAGQQQRIGIARALFSKPEILIMDEATSALDSLTEKDLTESLAKLRSKLTLVVVAHRLSTIIDADKIVYVSNGKILAEGSMAEVRRKVPDFNKQAEILGIPL